jgi:hypothetical protein
MKQYLFHSEKEWWEKFGCSIFIYYFCRTKGLTRIEETTAHNNNMVFLEGNCIER